MHRKIPLSRRDALKGLAGASSLAAFGVGASIIGTQPVTAASVNIGGLSVSTDDGDLSYVDLNLDDHWAIWRNFDIPVAAVAYRDVLKHPKSGNSHILYDGRSDPGPVKLENFSSKGSGGDGWGGPDEYASENPDSYVQATGPTTSGFVHAGVNWQLAHDPGEGGAKSIEDPAVFGDTFPDFDNDDDGTTQTYTWQLVKQVWLYALEDTGSGVTRATQDGNDTVYLMGPDDGTREKIVATPEFDVAVENQPSSTSVQGDGSTSGG